MILLHLTDLHYDHNSAFQRELIAALIKDIETRAELEIAPDLVVFSGDLVQNPDEEGAYELFSEK